MKYKWLKIYVIKGAPQKDEQISIKDVKRYPIYLCRKCYYESIIATNYCSNCGRKYKKRYE